VGGARRRRIAPARIAQHHAVPGHEAHEQITRDSRDPHRLVELLRPHSHRQAQLGEAHAGEGAEEERASPHGGDAGADQPPIRRLRSSTLRLS
jgi:hypothetical protein